MKCPFYNNEIPSGSVFCIFCGNNVSQSLNRQPDTHKSPYSYQNPYSQKPSTPQIDDAGCLAIFISFMSPFVGLALYLIWKDYRPNSAKTCLITAIISFCISFLGGIVMVITAVSLSLPLQNDDYSDLIRLFISCIRL
jgi:hypothetical protein